MRDRPVPQTLGGPFNAWLHSPVVGLKAADLGEELRFRSALTPRQRELAILVVGAHWKAEFEFWAHAEEGRRVGVTDDVIEAVRDGRAPELADRREAIVASISAELVASGGLADESYADALDELGPEALVDLVLMVGYYCMVSLTLNAFDVGLPRGIEPVWDAEGR